MSSPPAARVDFGLGAFLTADGGATVSGAATVQVKTGGLRTMPMFAGRSGCDWGRQTLTDPANNPAPVQPTLFANAETNGTRLEANSVVLTDSAQTTVQELLTGSTLNRIQFTARQWDRTKRVGFFPSDATAQTDQDFFWLASDISRADLSPDSDANSYTRNQSEIVQAMIPDTVAAQEGVWWIRVWNASTNSWSPASDALPFRVGGAVLECASSSNEGNFGTLRWPRTTPNQTSEHLPANIAMGLRGPAHSYRPPDAGGGRNLHP